MRARPLCITALGFLLGILTASTENKWILLPVIGIFLWLAVNIRKEKSRFWAYGKMLFYTLGFFCGALRYGAQQEFRTAYEPRLYDGKKIVLQGELEEKEYKNNTYLYYLKNCYLRLEADESFNQSNITGIKIVPCNQIVAEMESDSIPIGTILVLEGSVTVFHQARNEGNFDEKTFYQSQKIDFKLKNVCVQSKQGEPNAFREMLYQLKQRIKSVYTACMTRENCGVMTMMSLGDKTLMDIEIKELYQRVGISHVLAISGLHISVIGMTLYKFFRKACGSFVISGIFAGSFMFAYGCMTGFRPSSTRAIMMFFVMLIGQMLGRSYDSLSALCLSAICLLWENPYLLEYAGFLFSYMAVLGVVLIGKIVTGVFEEKHKIRDMIYSGFSIQLMTVPLTAFFYYEVPVYGMFVNFLVLPLMSILLFFGLLGGFLGLVWIEAAKWIFMPCQFILWFYQKLSVFIQGLPCAVLITGQPEIKRIIIFYSILAGLVYGTWKGKKVRGYFVVGAILLAFVLYIPKSGMELNVLDVGQGDGIHFRTSSGYEVFIDGGSTDAGKVGIYRILPFFKYNAIRKIDYWFISHTDRDHISGLKEILEEGYRVDNLVLAESIERDAVYEELMDLAEKNDTEVLYIGYLDSLHLGEAELTCVFPYEQFYTTDKNAGSLVLYYEDGTFDGLFTGDIGMAEENWIAEHSGEWLADIDFYKAAHHGSRYSNGKKLLDVIQPEIAVISCGENNSYGHPSAETVERIKNAGAEIFYTMDSGQIKIWTKKGRISINEYCSNSMLSTYENIYFASQNPLRSNFNVTVHTVLSIYC